MVKQLNIQNTMGDFSLMHEIKCPNKSSCLPFLAKFCCWEKTHIALTARVLTSVPSWYLPASALTLHTRWCAAPEHAVRRRHQGSRAGGAQGWTVKMWKTGTSWLGRQLRFAWCTRVQCLPHLNSTHILSFSSIFFPSILRSKCLQLLS